MKSALRVVPLALLLAAAVPLPSVADSAAECRKMAAEDEVAAEDMEDYLAECLAANDADAADAPDEGAPAGDPAGGDAPGADAAGKSGGKSGGSKAAP